VEPLIDWSALGAFTLLWLVIVPTPGPNSLMVTHVAVTRAAGDVALAILGNLAGIMLLAAAALLGWAALLQVFPWLRTLVHVLGGAYLAYFGLRLVTRSRAAAAGGGAPDGDARAGSWSALALGFTTSISNAQAIVFITSIYAVTGVLAASAATGLATIAIIVVCNGIYLAALGWLFQRPAIRAAYARFRQGLQATIGVAFVGFGGRLLWRELA
jgi:threonine/homoserine/homoserine lactone efflux protein